MDASESQPSDESLSETEEEVKKMPLKKCSSLDSIPGKSKKVKEKIRDLQEQRGKDMETFISKFYEFGENLKDIGYCDGPSLELRVLHDKFLDEVYKTLMKPSRIPLSYYRKVRIFHYLNRNHPEYEDKTEETFAELGTRLFRGTHEGLFDFPSLEAEYVYPNPASTSHVKWFEFVGKILALSIIQVETIGVHLPLCFFKCLLDRPLSIHDLREVDPMLHDRLVWMKESRVSGREPPITFTIHERMGHLSYDTELMPNGRQRCVTEENKNEYIEKCIKWKLAERCLMQFKLIRKGFTSVLDPDLLESLTETEIQYVLEKCPFDVYLSDWRENGGATGVEEMKEQQLTVHSD